MAVAYALARSWDGRHPMQVQGLREMLASPDLKNGSLGTAKGIRTWQPHVGLPVLASMQQHGCQWLADPDQCPLFTEGADGCQI